MRAPWGLCAVWAAALCACGGGAPGGDVEVLRPEAGVHDRIPVAMTAERPTGVQGERIRHYTVAVRAVSRAAEVVARFAFDVR